MKFDASIHNLDSMIHQIEAVAKEAGCNEETIRRIELAAEEGLVNVIHYAYPQGKAGSIELECRVTAQQELEIVIRDEGKPFDPLNEAPKADRRQPLAERVPGGWGIALMRKMVDDVRYSREHGCNTLTLVKKLR